MWAFFPPHISSSRKLEVLMYHMCMYVCLFPYKSKSDLKENSRRRMLKTSAEGRAIYGKPPATLRLSIFTYTAVSGHLTPPSPKTEVLDKYSQSSDWGKGKWVSRWEEKTQMSEKLKGEVYKKKSKRNVKESKKIKWVNSKRYSRSKILHCCMFMCNRYYPVSCLILSVPPEIYLLALTPLQPRRSHSQGNPRRPRADHFHLLLITFDSSFSNLSRIISVIIQVRFDTGMKFEGKSNLMNAFVFVLFCFFIRWDILNRPVFAKARKKKGSTALWLNQQTKPTAFWLK